MVSLLPKPALMNPPLLGFTTIFHMFVCGGLVCLHVYASLQVHMYTDKQAHVCCA